MSTFTTKTESKRTTDQRIFWSSVIQIMAACIICCEFRLQAQSQKGNMIYVNNNMLCTAFCCCKICTKGAGIDATGQKPVEGITVAIPRQYPLGSTVIISGHEYRGTDRYNKNLSDRIDIYFESHDDAVRFGKQHRSVTIITPKKG